MGSCIGKRRRSIGVTPYLDKFHEHSCQCRAYIDEAQQIDWIRNPKCFLDIQDMLFQTGIEHQPGPLGTHCPEQVVPSVTCGRSTSFVLEVGNITNLATHLHQVGEIKANAFAFQEHSCPKADWSKAIQYLRSKRKRTILGPLDPEAKHNLAGVGILSDHNRPVIRVKPRTLSFQKAYTTCRCDYFALDTSM